DATVTGVQTCALPISKWATRLIKAATMMAVIPERKKNGMMGINAPSAVEIVAETAATQGLGKLSSDNPSSSCARVRRNCSGFSRSEERRVGKDGGSRW